MPTKLDRRTRRDSDCRSIAAAAFFEEEFPRLAERNGALVASGMRWLEAPPLTVEVGEQAWSIAAEGEKLVAANGNMPGALVVALSEDQFSRVAQNLVTFNGLLVTGELQPDRTNREALSSWDGLWHTLLEGWTVLPEQLSFVDRHGQPLDLNASFTPASDPADIAHFLREAGFLHLRGWLDPTDMARISREMDAALPDYSEGDGKSWWATMADGSRACVRLQDFVERSPTTQALLEGPQWDLLHRVLAGHDHLERKPAKGRIIEALFKPVGIVSGPSDLTFHRDCHLGRHAYACSRMTVGISLTASGPGNGQLQVIAGSHRVGIPVEHAKTRPYLPVVAMQTDPGDLTVHLSCTLHEATPPVSSERRVMYTEIPLAGGPVDTSVEGVRGDIDAILKRRAPV